MYVFVFDFFLIFVSQYTNKSKTNYILKYYGK